MFQTENPVFSDWLANHFRLGHYTESEQVGTKQNIAASNAFRNLLLINSPTRNHWIAIRGIASLSRVEGSIGKALGKGVEGTERA